MASVTVPSVQSLLIEMRVNGNTLSTGTGFVVQAPRGPVLVTNRHNVTGRNNGTNEALSPTGGLPDEIIILHNAPVLGHWVGRSEELFDKSGAPAWVEHPVLGAKADVVALPLTQTAGTKLYPHDVAPVRKIICGPSDVVSVIGFPFGMTAGGAFAVWATGFVASEPDIDFANLPVFLIDCRTRRERPKICVS